MDQSLVVNTLPAAGRGKWRAAVAGVACSMLATYRLGGKMFWMAPVIVAFAVLPELVQHGAEVKMGMFASKDAFRALANDPTRWAFGYAKIAGLWLGILLTVRFLATGGWGQMFRMPRREVGRLVLAVGATLLADEALKRGGEAWGAAMVLGTLSAFLQAGLTLYVIAIVAGERTIDLRGAFWRFLPTSLLLALLMAAAFVPAQALHTANHLAAMSQPLPLVAVIMLFDSLLVGLMATLLGSAMVVTVRAAPTWNGWTREPATLA